MLCYVRDTQIIFSSEHHIIIIIISNSSSGSSRRSGSEIDTAEEKHRKITASRSPPRRAWLLPEVIKTVTPPTPPSLTPPFFSSAKRFTNLLSELLLFLDEQNDGSTVVDHTWLSIAARGFCFQSISSLFTEYLGMRLHSRLKVNAGEQWDISDVWHDHIIEKKHTLTARV